MNAQPTEMTLTTLTVPQPLRGQTATAAYTDTNTLRRTAHAVKKVPGNYTDIDVLAKGKTASDGRPGSYADVHTVVGRMSAWGRQGSYTDVDR
jgi:hypothetical protein